MAGFSPYQDMHLPGIPHCSRLSGMALIILLKLRGLTMKDFPLGLWLSKIDDHERGKECCFCPGDGFGTQSPTGCSGRPVWAVLLWCWSPPAPRMQFWWQIIQETCVFPWEVLRFCFVPWFSFSGPFPFPSLEAFVFLTWQMSSGKLMVNYLKGEGNIKPI